MKDSSLRFGFYSFGTFDNQKMTNGRLSVKYYDAIINYLINSTVRSLRENFKPRPTGLTSLSRGQYGKTSVWDLHVTTEWSRLLSCLLYGSSIKRKIIGAEVVNLHPAMPAVTDSFIVSNLGKNYTVSEFHHCITYSVKNTHFFTEKSLSQSQNVFYYPGTTNWWGGFSGFWGETSTPKPTVFPWKKIQMLQNTLLKISFTRSSHSLSTMCLRLLHSGIYEWTFQALWTTAVIRNTATDRNCPIVYIWWS